jgi:hypothetical protein
MHPSIDRFNCLLEAVATGDSHVMGQVRPQVLPYLRVIARRALRSKEEVPAWHKAPPGAGSSASSASGRKSSVGGSRAGRLARQIYQVLVEGVQSKRASPSHERTRLFKGPRTITARASPAD